MSRHFVAIALTAISLPGAAGCRRPPPPPPAAIDAGAPRVSIDAGAPRDVAFTPPDAGPPHVLTIRITNTFTAPMTLLTNQDTNEMVHTRHLFPRRNPDAGVGPNADGELVKFFPVGQEPSCSEDAGVGYGGLGQPEPRTLAPGESMDILWDGSQRHEVLSPRGVCQQEGPPATGRYRFELDQPYNLPQCTRPIVTWPLEADAPRVVEIRCFRPSATPHE